MKGYVITLVVVAFLTMVLTPFGAAMYKTNAAPVPLNIQPFGWVHYNGASGVSSGMSSSWMSWEFTGSQFLLNDPVHNFNGAPQSSSQGSLSSYEQDAQYAINTYGTYINGASSEYNVPSLIIVAEMCVESSGGQGGGNVMQESSYTGVFTDSNGVTYHGAAASIYQATAGWLSPDYSKYNGDPFLIGAAYNAGHVYYANQYSGGVGDNVWHMMMYASYDSSTGGYTEGSYDWKLAVALNAALVVMGNNQGGGSGSGSGTGSGGTGTTGGSPIAVGDGVKVIANPSLNVRSGPGLKYAIIGSEDYGATGVVESGPVYSGGYQWWNINYNGPGWGATSGWSAASGPTGTFLIVTSSSQPVSQPSSGSYNGGNAVSYANYIINTEHEYGSGAPPGNGAYTSGYGYANNQMSLTQNNLYSVGGDCAHFVSQALIAGGISSLNSVDSYAPGYGEVNVAGLEQYLLSNGIGQKVSSVNDLQPGDVILYYWNGVEYSGDSHATLYIGNGEVAQHSYGGGGGEYASQSTSWGVNWATEAETSSSTLVVFIHITGNSQPSSGGSGSGSSSSPQSAYGITVGSNVEVIVGELNVRSSPAGDVITMEQYGSLGSVVNGPIQASLNGVSYIWWEIQYNNGVTGWSAEGNGNTQYLQVVNGYTDAYGITVGSQVQVIVSGLNVLTSPAGNIITTEQNGAIGTVVAGPEEASLNGVSYVWWEIQYNNGVTGWSAEGNGNTAYLQVTG
ncbi:MAG: amidase domain-containing protein [Thermoplasmata archaeon]